jgi:hypothetical protein
MRSLGGDEPRTRADERDLIETFVERSRCGTVEQRGRLSAGTNFDP